MEFKGTKGEWEVTDKKNSNLKNVYSPNHSNWSIAEDMLEADAKLIAAAPEMLQMVIEMKAVMNQLSGRMGEQMEIEVNKRLDSVIEKATK